MAVTGIRWNPPSNIIDVFKKHGGVITRVAKDLNVCRYTIYERLNEDAELKEALVDIRKGHVEFKCDIAEETIAYLMERAETDPSNALKASMFTLNNLGKDRNYASEGEKAAMATSCAADNANKVYATKIAEKAAS